MQYYDNQNPNPAPYRYQEEVAPTVRFGDWLVTLLIMAVPLVNLIMLFVWALDSKVNPSKSNWAKAYLVIIGIQILLAIFFIGLFMGAAKSLIGDFQAAAFQ